MTLEARTFANRSGIASPRVLPGRREESPSFEFSDIPLSRGSHRSHRRYPGVRASARCGRRLRSNFAEQSQFGRVTLDGKSFVGRCLRRIHAGKGRGRQSQFPEWKGIRQDRGKAGPAVTGAAELVQTSTDKRVCPWHPRLHPARTYGKQSQFPEWRAADCRFRGGGRWRILISLMDAGRCGVENRPVRLQWSGPGTACPAFGRL